MAPEDLLRLRLVDSAWTLRPSPPEPQLGPGLGLRLSWPELPEGTVITVEDAETGAQLLALSL